MAVSYTIHSFANSASNTVVTMASFTSAPGTLLVLWCGTQAMTTVTPTSAHGTWIPVTTIDSTDSSTRIALFWCWDATGHTGGITFTSGTACTKYPAVVECAGSWSGGYRQFCKASINAAYGTFAASFAATLADSGLLAAWIPLGTVPSGWTPRTSWTQILAYNSATSYTQVDGRAVGGGDAGISMTVSSGTGMLLGIGVEIGAPQSNATQSATFGAQQSTASATVTVTASQSATMAPQWNSALAPPVVVAASSAASATTLDIAAPGVLPSDPSSILVLLVLSTGTGAPLLNTPTGGTRKTWNPGTPATIGTARLSSWWCRPSFASGTIHLSSVGAVACTWRYQLLLLPNLILTTTAIPIEGGPGTGTGNLALAMSAGAVDGILAAFASDISADFVSKSGWTEVSDDTLFETQWEYLAQDRAPSVVQDPSATLLGVAFGALAGANVQAVITASQSATFDPQASTAAAAVVVTATQSATFAAQVSTTTAHGFSRWGYHNVFGDPRLTRMSMDALNGSSVVCTREFFGTPVIRNLHGAAVGTGTAAGVLSVRRSLSSAAAGASTAAATATVRRALGGSCQSTAPASGILAVLRKLAGAATGSSTAAGVLLRAEADVGQATGAGLAAGALFMVRALTGTATGTGLAAGVLTCRESLSGTAAGSATAAAALLAYRGETGSSAAAGHATGQPVVLRSLAASAAGAGAAVATLTRRLALASAAAGTSAAAGVLGGWVNFTGAASGSSSAAGVLYLADEAVGVARGASSASGDLQLLRALVGFARGVADAEATLTLELSLAGTAHGGSTAAGVLGAGSALPVVVCRLTAIGRVTATITQLGGVSAALTPIGRIAATLKEIR